MGYYGAGGWGFGWWPRLRNVNFGNSKSGRMANVVYVICLAAITGIPFFFIGLGLFYIILCGVALIVAVIGNNTLTNMFAIAIMAGVTMFILWLCGIFG